jgi:flagellin-like protein
MKNNKGLSAVVTTLIIILLTIVAIMIIWGVVKGLLDNSSKTIDKSTKCLEIDIQATKVVNNSAGNYSVTVARTSGGEDIIEGIEIVLQSDSDASDVTIFEEAFGPMKVKTFSIYKEGLSNVSRAIVSAYFTDSNGEKQRCPETTYNFKAI